MAIANLIITKNLMMWPSVKALGFLILLMRKNPGVLKPEKNFAPAAPVRHSLFFLNE
jgi:hypothetical protein